MTPDGAFMSFDRLYIAIVVEVSDLDSKILTIIRISIPIYTTFSTTVIWDLSDIHTFSCISSNNFDDYLVMHGNKYPFSHVYVYYIYKLR